MSRMASWGSFTRASQALLLLLIIVLLAKAASSAAVTERRRHLQETKESDDSACLKGFIDLAKQKNSTVGTWTSTAIENPCKGISAGELKGVTCNNSKVVSIELPAANLTGTIPASLSSCRLLQVLNLSSNSLSGALPSWLGTDLSELSRLSLSNNNLSGPIPDELATLGSLTYVDLSHNQLSGFIPSQFGLLDYLQSFNVSYNNLSGLIPSTFTPRFNASSFSHNSKLFGYPLTPSPPFSPYTSPPSPPHNKSSNVPLIVGIGFASGFGCLLITLCIAWQWVRLRRRRYNDGQWERGFHQATLHDR